MLTARGKHLSPTALLAGVLAWTSVSTPVVSAQQPAGKESTTAPATTEKATPAKAASPSGGAELFDSPQAAVDAVLKAASDYDTDALAKIFGPDGKEVYATGDAVQDKNRAESFVAEAKEKTKISVDPKTGRRAVVIVGKEDWPCRCHWRRQEANGISTPRPACGSCCIGASALTNWTRFRFAAVTLRRRTNTL